MNFHYVTDFLNVIILQRGSFLNENIKISQMIILITFFILKSTSLSKQRI